MSKPLYFNADAIDHEYDDARCYPITLHRQEMEEHGETERRLYRAIPEHSSTHFWCKELQVVEEKGTICGKPCPAYDPRNGFSGRCRHSAGMYDFETKEVKVIRAKQTATP